MLASPKIKKLHLKNFKCFESLDLEFKNITLLAGVNGAGKSSVIQSLLLLKQSILDNSFNSNDNNVLALNGEFVEIGKGKDALYEYAKSDILSIGIVGENGALSYQFIYDADLDILKFKEEQELSKDERYRKIYELSNSGLIDKSFQYLRAERIGPSPTYFMSDRYVKSLNQIGLKGEFAAHYLAEYGKTDAMLPQLFHPNQSSSKLLDQVEAWMGEISPGVQITATPVDNAELVSLSYAFKTNKEFSNKYRSTNVGFGITYALPVVLALLNAKAGAVVIIENPEAHLHPKGQTKMGELLARAASAGIQIIVETHSDHILNSLRIAVKHKVLTPEQISINFFRREEYAGYPYTEVVPIAINNEGQLNYWPEEFFDEWDKNLQELL